MDNPLSIPEIAFLSKFKADENFNPRNIQYMSVVKISIRLELETKILISGMDNVKKFS